MVVTAGEGATSGTSRAQARLLLKPRTAVTAPTQKVGPEGDTAPEQTLPSHTCAVRFTPWLPRVLLAPVSCD